MYLLVINADGLPEAELVHGHRQVPGLVEAPVEVAVVHGNEVHITEDKALVVILLQGFSVANIQEFGPVKCLISFLSGKPALIRHVSPKTFLELQFIPPS